MRSPRQYTWFSDHAYARVQERLTMDSEEVADLLDADLVVRIGQDPDAECVHRLFYSYEDRQCFVAVQNEKTKKLITILPVDYYETLSARISQGALQEAERLVSAGADMQDATAGPQRISRNVQTKSHATVIPSAFRITGIVAAWGKAGRRINLGPWPVGATEGSVEKLLEDEEFVEAIKQRVQPELQDGEYVQCYIIRLGKKGDWWSVGADEEGHPIPR